MAETPMRFIRVDDELWARVKARAHSEGTTASEVGRALFDEYANQSPDDELRQITRRLANLRKRLKG